MAGIMQRHHHILNAASNLLGIALIIITGLHISGSTRRTIADEVAWVAAAFFAVSILLSYVALRDDPEPSRLESWADRIFLAGLVCLVLSVFAFAAVDM